MSKKLFVVVALLVLVSMLVSSCAAGSGETVIRIATQSPLSGDMSLIGGDIKNGAELAIAQLSGPLNEMGFKIELIPYDDMGDPTTGVNNAKKIVADTSILCVVGHYNSGVQIPSSEEYHAAGLANVSPANTNPQVTTRGYTEVSRIVGRDDMQGAVGAEFAFGQGMTSAYVLHDKTTYGQGIAEYFRQRAEELGMSVLGFDGTEEKSNFDAILSPIIASNPDVLYFGGMYGQAALLFKQAREKGYMGMFMSDDGFDSADAAKIGGDLLLQGTGTYYSTVSGPASAYEGTAKFQADFEEKYGHTPQPFAAQSYDSAAICLKAIEAAAKAANGETPTRAAVVEAVRDLVDFPGITGTINFNGNGDLTEARYFIIQVTSSDETKWAENTIAQILVLAPPE